MNGKTTYLILGSNAQDKRENINEALQRLNENSAIKVEKISSIYETRAWGIKEQPAFLNCAVKLKTKFAPHQLLRFLKSIEKKMGRKKRKKWGKRKIDLDIIFYGKDVIEARHLVIPHPLIQERNFVLIPLAEIAGGFIHPGLKKKISTLSKVCLDESWVRALKKTSTLPQKAQKLREGRKNIANVAKSFH